MGLFFVSKYVFAKYFPIIPIQSSCIPLINNKMQTSDGQPPTGSPIRIVFTIMTAIAINEIRQNTIPITADTTKGTVEKAVMASIA